LVLEPMLVLELKLVMEPKRALKLEHRQPGLPPSPFFFSFF